MSYAARVGSERQTAPPSEVGTTDTHALSVVLGLLLGLP